MVILTSGPFVHLVDSYLVDSECGFLRHLGLLANLAQARTTA